MTIGAARRETSRVLKLMRMDEWNVEAKDIIDHPDEPQALGRVEYNNRELFATIYLDLTRPDDLVALTIKHEVVHLLINELEVVAKQAFRCCSPTTQAVLENMLDDANERLTVRVARAIHDADSKWKV